MSVDSGEQTAAEPQFKTRDLRVVLEIERGGPCVLDDLTGEIVDIDVRLDEQTCNVDVTVCDESESHCASKKYVSNDICDHCPGSVFSEYGCLPRYIRVGDGEFVMETYVSDTETVAEIVSDVREICERVSVLSIVSTDKSQFQEICSVDISKLTGKQRKAVTVARDRGYYNPDTSVPLDELADELEITPSAMSQRLRRAESNIIRQISCDGGPLSE